MTQKRYTYNQMVTLGDIAVMDAKRELAHDIAVDKKYSQTYGTHV